MTPNHGSGVTVDGSSSPSRVRSRFTHTCMESSVPIDPLQEYTVVAVTIFLIASWQLHGQHIQVGTDSTD